MVLCNICQSFDVRGLLLFALEEKAKKGHVWHKNDYMYRYSRYLRYHDNILSVKASAQMGCELCVLVWQEVVMSWAGEATDQQLQTEYGGPVYLGALALRDMFSIIIHGELQPSTDGSGSRAWRVGDLEICANRGIPPSPRHFYFSPWLTMKNTACIPIDRPELTGILSTQIFSDSTSQACLAVAAEWLESCLENHPDCVHRLAKQHPLPARVIDVGTASTIPYLYVTNGRIGSWAALSYCWGGNSKFTLSSGSFDALQQGYPLAEYPQTLRDAIIVTRSLGIRYLWIDAVCILQDSRDDWESESAKMGQIYRDAVVTIIAAASYSVTAGILGPRSGKPSCNLTWRIPESETLMTRNSTVNNGSIDSLHHEVSVRSYMYIRDYWNEQSPWASRAWTMQEYLLSTRILFFASDQMIWECVTEQATESGLSHNRRYGDASPGTRTNFQSFKQLSASPSSTVKITDRRSPFGLYFLWYDLVRSYSQRSLTKGIDRLPALAGLARHFQLRTGDSYCAGLWKGDLLHGLIWNYHGKTGSLSEYIGPSWSWVSLDGSLDGCRLSWRLQQTEDKDVTKLARIENIHLEYQSPDIYGQLKGGQLTLTAPYHHLSAISEDTGVTTQPSTDFHRHIFEIFKPNDYRAPEYQPGTRAYVDEIQWSRLEFNHKHRGYTGQHFAAMQILAEMWSCETRQPAVELLILESTKGDAMTGSASGEVIVYRRIAQVTLRPLIIKPDGSDNGVSRVEGAASREISNEEWPIKTVTII